ncbi:MAG TPA: YceI family protein [Gallionella sp.]|nr:YceI family protein [Gallionella sp.]
MRRWMAALLLCAASLATAGQFTELDPRQSGISFVSKQMGVPVEGTFGKFTARVAVDPAKPEAGTARIDIDLASIDTGNDDANEEVKGKAWFDIRNHPTASFVSSQVNSLGKGHYEVLGRMTLKGKTLNIRAPFTLGQQANALLIEGMFPIKRLDYGIGSGIWSDTDTVADEVQIRFRFALTKK